MRTGRHPLWLFRGHICLSPVGPELKMRTEIIVRYRSSPGHLGQLSQGTCPAARDSRKHLGWGRARCLPSCWRRVLGHRWVKLAKVGEVVCLHMTWVPFLWRKAELWGMGGPARQGRGHLCTSLVSRAPWWGWDVQVWSQGAAAFSEAWGGFPLDPQASPLCEN